MNLEKIITERQWGKTRAGAAFTHFENLVGKAWCTDQRETATLTSMKRDWAESDKARQELIHIITDFQSLCARAADALEYRNLDHFNDDLIAELRKATE